MFLQQTPDLKYLPKRIISLVPSQTELLFNLGLTAEVVGITKFCLHPKLWFTTKERVGGTKTVKIDKIHQLKPDLIIANKEENVKEQIEELSKHYPVWLTDVNNLNDALTMIADIGILTGKKEEAINLTFAINNSFANLKKLIIQNQKPKTAYLIWQKPYITVGGDTFINDMLQQCGFNNVFAGKNRYPQTSIEDLQIANCQFVFLSSEPYPFKQKHIDELSVHLPATKIMLVDGEFFSWYGSRLLKAADYFTQLIAEIA